MMQGKGEWGSAVQWIQSFNFARLKKFQKSVAQYDIANTTELYNG